MPRTLFGRSLLMIVLPLALVQVIAALFFFERHWEAVSRRLALGLAGDVAAVISAMRDFPGDAAQERILNAALHHMEIVATVEAGAILPNAPPPVVNSLDRMLTRVIGERLFRPYHVDAHSNPERVFITVQLREGVLHVSTTRKRVFSSTTYVFIIWMVGGSLVLLGIAMIFLRNQIRPVRRLVVAVDAFGKGRDVGDFKPEGASEIRQAAAAFNLMRERIQRQISERVEMLAGISHDLRTPLARMKLELAMLGNAEEIANLKADVIEMEKMVEAYLDFARGEGAEAPVRTNIATVLKAVVGAARRRGDAVELRYEGDLTVALRRDAFQRCITNLVDNAARYGDRVSVTARRDAGTIEIDVDDDGPGIPAENRDEVFRPFHRLEQSRNVETGGVGLGLTIARDAVRGMGGDISLGDSPGGGLRARIRLPL